MAVTEIPKKLSVAVLLDDGTTASGNVRTISKNVLSDLNTDDYTDQKAVNIINALSPLYSKTIYAIQKTTQVSLLEE